MMGIKFDLNISLGVVSVMIETLIFHAFQCKHKESKWPNGIFPSLKQFFFNEVRKKISHVQIGCLLSKGKKIIHEQLWVNSIMLKHVSLDK